ncbi:hypothetical protein PYJP_11560 [Pyrofollis japonicus]|uniref:hypothetical protein n=1 Tax=Pyrofollis japonicus TaxID=3060460 RepID=UPI00295A634F|nr:hypothetical protein [Pyrofollis japonicus]BEP17804.1 hypothetical protein PYJP_11560 [Pyrofollis japonicus]
MEEANVENLVKEYAGLLEELGFGKIEIAEFDSKHAVIKMKNPPSMAGIALVKGSAEKLLLQGKKICHLEAGMMAGAFEEVLNAKYQGLEKEHGSVDDPYCIIEVKKIGG